MNLLLTNDDGLGSSGLWALYHHLKKRHNVTVVAPDQDRSGCSHSFSIKTPVRIKPVKSGIWCCYGTPADCVFAAIHSLMSAKPDLVISGINPGPNLGTDIVYSGTAAAAREAVFRGVPGVALSVGNRKPPYHHDRVTQFLDHHWNTLLEMWQPGTFINVNFPEGKKGSPNENLVPTIPGNRIYHDEISIQESSSGDLYLFIKGDSITSDTRPETDTYRVSRGEISVSLVHCLPSGESWL